MYTCSVQPTKIKFQKPRYNYLLNVQMTDFSTAALFYILCRKNRMYIPIHQTTQCLLLTQKTTICISIMMKTFNPIFQNCIILWNFIIPYWRMPVVLVSKVCFITILVSLKKDVWRIVISLTFNSTTNSQGFLKIHYWIKKQKRCEESFQKPSQKKASNAAWLWNGII
jgi:hypothetical protein